VVEDQSQRYLDIAVCCVGDADAGASRNGKRSGGQRTGGRNNNDGTVDGSRIGSSSRGKRDNLRFHRYAGAVDRSPPSHTTTGATSPRTGTFGRAISTAERSWEAGMQLQDLFSPGTIKLDLSAVDKDEVFEELTDFLVRAHNLSVREEILDAIHEREEKMSTGVHRGIAVPHGKTDAVDRLLGVIGISKQGIDYDALDGHPVHLIFLLVSSAENTGPHLKMLRNIATLLQNPQFYPDLIAAKSADQAYRTLCHYEEALGIEEG